MSHLIIDTSTPYYLCIIATHETIQFAHLERYPSREASGLFVEKVFEGLGSLNLTASSLSAIILTHGPGSLTALRTGISLAQGMASAQQLPVYVLGSMALYAHAVKRPVLMDARCGYFYHYQRMNEIYPVMRDMSEMASLTGEFAVAGDWPFSGDYDQVLTEDHISDLHRAAFDLIQKVNPVSASDVSAFYLKPAVRQ
ncbi:hypothetical protein N9C31_01280 [Gammaproteobacteria bacterium]|nr:hypothetical protein [Gammaproteobacteria bacterium]